MVAIIALRRDLQNPHRNHHHHRNHDHNHHHRNHHQDHYNDDADPYVRVEDIEDGVCPVSLGFVKLAPDLLSASRRKHRDLLPAHHNGDHEADGDHEGDGGDDDDDGDDGPKSAFSNFVPYHQLSAIFGYFTIEYV